MVWNAARFDSFVLRWPNHAELCEFIILFIIDWLLMFVNQLQVGADLRHHTLCWTRHKYHPKEVKRRKRERGCTIGWGIIKEIFFFFWFCFCFQNGYGQEVFNLTPLPALTPCISWKMQIWILPCSGCATWGHWETPFKVFSPFLSCIFVYVDVGSSGTPFDHNRLGGGGASIYAPT